MAIPLLVLDEDERIARANPLARALLGDCVGQKCWRTVLGRTDDGTAVCRNGCARALVCERSGSQADRPHVLVHGADWRLVCSDVGGTVVVALLPPAPSPAARLSQRECRVLTLVSEGLTDRLIARRLGIGAATVRTFVDRARDKLGAANRTEAVAMALVSGAIGKGAGG